MAIRAVAPGVALVVVVALLTLGLATRGEGQTPAHLKGLQAVKIVVEDLDEETRAEGIAARAVEDQVLVILRSKAPQLRYDPSVIPYLYVNINLLSSSVGYAGSVRLELNRPVEILVGVHRVWQEPRERIPTIVPVWRASYVIQGPRGNAPGHLRKTLDLLMERFLADYFKANP
jgi:hypothetical protein